MLALLAIAVLLPLFFATEPQRLAKQRSLIQRIRDQLTKQFGFTHLKPAGEGWDNQAGTKIMASIWLLLLGLTGLAYVWEGHLDLAFNVTIPLIITASFLASGCSSKTLVNVTRVALMQQALTFWFFEFKIEGTVLRRALVMRTIGTLIFFESLEEAFVHLFLITLALETRYRSSASAEDQSLLLLPVKMFFLAILPMHVLGLSEWISAQSTEQDFSILKMVNFLKGLRFFSCLISLLIIFNTFLAHTVRSAYLAMGCFLIGSSLVLRLSRFGPKVSIWIAPNTFAHQKRPASQWLQYAVLACTLLTAHMRAHALFVFTFSCSLGLALSGNAFQHRRFHEVQSNVCLFTGVTLIIVHNDAWAGSMALYLGVTSSFLSMLMVCAKEIVYTQIAQESAASNFVSHSLKQRFAAVGAAVEQIMSTQEYFPPILSKVMIMCGFGHARCYSSTIYRKLDQGEQRGSWKRTFENVREQLESTTMATLLGMESAEFVPGAAAAGEFFPAWVEMDWEILHLVLTDLARAGHKIIRVWCNQTTTSMVVSTSPQPIQFCLELDRAVAMDGEHRNVIMRGLIAELRGEFNTTANVLVLNAALGADRIAVERTKSICGCPKPVTVPRALDVDELQSLRFALLDDNVLIRKNFERLLQHNLRVPVQNISTWGASLEECVAFPNKIHELDVDIAIFDQNLEYEDGAVGLSGSELAARAKRLGFRGCLILHSSDVNIIDLLKRGVFHGAVEKTANGRVFIQGVADVWNSGGFKEYKE